MQRKNLPLRDFVVVVVAAVKAEAVEDANLVEVVEAEVEEEIEAVVLANVDEVGPLSERKIRSQKVELVKRMVHSCQHRRLEFQFPSHRLQR
jgi:hypothetical protein